MKHLKTFENINNSPKVGDYVILKPESHSTFAYGDINDHIYKIMEVLYIANRRMTKYKLDAFYDNTIKNDDYITKRYTFRDESDFLYWSPSEDDCKAHLQANKFNI
jgi:hypothetical protein